LCQFTNDENAEGLYWRLEWMGVGDGQFNPDELGLCIKEAEYFRIITEGNHTAGSKTMTDEELRRYGYADGSYQNKCTSCGGMFIGDKRARTCKGCATARNITLDQIPVELIREIKAQGLEEAIDEFAGLVFGGFMPKDGMIRWQKIKAAKLREEE
jgi:hypothetical protein